MRSRAEVLAAVRERLDRTAADQDPRWVLGEQALADAGELAAAAEVGGDLDAAYVLGLFYWFRFEACGLQAGQDDLAVAALFLIPVFTSDPGRLPEPVRRLYRQPGGPGGNTDPDAAAGRARALFSAYLGSGQLSLLREAVMNSGHDGRQQGIPHQTPPRITPGPHQDFALNPSLGFWLYREEKSVRRNRARRGRARWLLPRARRGLL